MKATPTKQDAEAVLAELLKEAVNGIGMLERWASGDAARFRHALLGVIRSNVCDIHRETSVRRVNDVQLSKQSIAENQGVATITYLYTLALVELARDANTQWDDAEILAGQFRHHLNNQIRIADCIDGRNGDFILKRGDDQ